MLAAFEKTIGRENRREKFLGNVHSTQPLCLLVLQTRSGAVKVMKEGRKSSQDL
jgi:hypothetical protein